MSIAFTGSLTHSGGILSAVRKQFKLASLKPVKRITFKFDPFVNETKSIRDFLAWMSSKKLIRTNPNCRLRYEVVNDRSEPTVEFSLENGGTVLMKCGNISTLEMFQLYNKYITVLVPKEDSQGTVVATKSSKKTR